MAEQPINPNTNNPYRPFHLPPPTILPLRHCSHNDNDQPIDEVECLLSLLCPNADAMRNKEHYVLATAEPVSLPEQQQPRRQPERNFESSKESSNRIGDNNKNPKKGRREEILQRERDRRAAALRSGARSVPGVPIIYVKRSVMILEPLSTPSEKVRLGIERSKFKTGLDAAISSIGGGTKRKREDDEHDENTVTASKIRGLKKAKAPNPLSVRKPKKREKQRPEHEGKKGALDAAPNADQQDNVEDHPDGTVADETGTVKNKRKRRHKSAKASIEDSRESDPVAQSTVDE